MDNERQKALDTVIKNMEKSFGKGAVMKLGDNKGRRVSSTSSGSVTVDNALGVGGYPNIYFMRTCKRCDCRISLLIYKIN